MKFGWKRLLAVGTALVLSLSLSAPALAAGETAGIAVQLDGANVTFIDAVPEVKDQRTFLPFRAVFEAMGATVDWHDTTVTAVRGDTTITMQLGSTAVTVQEGTSTRTVAMDVAPYVKNNRTYVPIRFAAEAFGCNVGWDQAAQTVLILDPEGLIGDATFEIMNAAIAGQEKPQGNQALDGDFRIRMNMGADGTYDMTGEVSGVASQTAMDLAMSMDLSALAQEMTAEDLGVTEAQADAVRDYMEDILKDASFAMRMDLDQGSCYFNVPILAEFLAEQGVTENTWYSLDLSGLGLTGLTAAQIVTMEDLLDQMLTGTLDNAAVAQSLASTVRMYACLFQDAAFTRSGDTYTAVYEGAQMGMAMETKTVIRMDGDKLRDISMDMTMSAAGTAVTYDITASTTKVDMTMTMSEPTTGMEMKMDFAMSVSATTKAPETGLPAGAQEVSLEALMAQAMSAGL